MALTRKPHWQTRAFHDLLYSRAFTPFAWGTNDCASFSADGILAITGTDIMAELRGYTTWPGAMQKIHEVTGGSSLEDAIVWCATKYGLQERTHPLMAQRGDLVLYRNADGTSAAGLVHLTGRHIVSPGETGLLRMPITTVIRSWSY